MAQTKTINKSFSGVDRILLNTTAGDCTLKKGSGTEVKVDMEYTYSDDVFEAIFEQNGSTLEMKEEFERNSNSRGNSKWTLTIPDNISIKFNTGSGDFVANDLDFDLKSNLGSGDVNLSNVNGDLTLNTGSGAMTFLQVEGDISANAGSGDIDLKNSTGDFSLNVGSGDITATNATGKFSLNVGSGDVEAEALTLTASSSFNSGSGNASVTLGGPLTSNISVNSGSGNATLDFNGEAINGIVTMKANKKNGAINAPFKFDSEEEEVRGNQTILKKTAKFGNSDINIKVGTGSGTASIEK